MQNEIANGRDVEEPFDDAQVYGRLDDVDKALDTLHRNYEVRSFFLTFIKIDPAYDSLRSDPRFVSLTQRMGW